MPPPASLAVLSSPIGQAARVLAPISSRCGGAAHCLDSRSARVHYARAHRSSLSPSRCPPVGVAVVRWAPAQRRRQTHLRAIARRTPQDWSRYPRAQDEQRPPQIATHPTPPIPLLLHRRVAVQPARPRERGKPFDRTLAGRTRTRAAVASRVYRSRTVRTSCGCVRVRALFVVVVGRVKEGGIASPPGTTAALILR